MDTASSGKVQRWALFLQQFDLKVCVISGRNNGMPDWLSRSTVEPDDAADEEIEAISNPVYLLSTTDNIHPISVDVSPYLPTLPQWKINPANISKVDKPYVKLAADGLWYSVRGSKLYVPPHLRESIIYWFHASRYGDHLGVNRTTRRITQWFYWLKLKKDIATYINACLPCRRVGSPGIRYLRQVLERAEPFQLISLDYVGPRDWAGQKVYYLVIINHFSRFLIARAISHPNAAETINIMKDMRITHFGALEVILVDRGGAFISDLFQHFVCDELAALLVYRGAGYPQGNSLNEAVHKGIEASLAVRRQYDMFSHYSDILCDATLAYNSTPHSSLGVSPYFTLFGKYMSLPGLQRFEERVTEEKRMATIYDIRKQAMQRVVMETDNRIRLYEPKTLTIGDDVVYHLQHHEKKTEASNERKELLKYSPS